MVLVCVGRREFRDGLGVEEVGVQMDGKKIKVRNGEEPSDEILCVLFENVGKERMERYSKSMTSHNSEHLVSRCFQPLKFS